MDTSTMFWFFMAAVFVVVGGLVTYNYIHGRWLYRPSRRDIALLLSSSLMGNSSSKEIDYFISMPVRHDQLLETIRNDFATLYGPTSFTTDGTWTPAARMQVEALLTLIEPPNNSFKPKPLRGSA
jgi:hypothetical protein